MWEGEFGETNQEIFGVVQMGDKGIGIKTHCEVNLQILRWIIKLHKEDGRVNTDSHISKL